jgi:hypothetical protein
MKSLRNTGDLKLRSSVLLSSALYIFAFPWTEATTPMGSEAPARGAVRANISNETIMMILLFIGAPSKDDFFGFTI